MFNIDILFFVKDIPAQIFNIKKYLEKLKKKKNTKKTIKFQRIQNILMQRRKCY